MFNYFGKRGEENYFLLTSPARDNHAEKNDNAPAELKVLFNTRCLKFKLKKTTGMFKTQSISKPCRSQMKRECPLNFEAWNYCPDKLGDREKTENHKKLSKDLIS